jgi:hypothetical protein
MSQSEVILPHNHRCGAVVSNDFVDALAQGQYDELMRCRLHSLKEEEEIFSNVRTPTKGKRRGGSTPSPSPMKQRGVVQLREPLPTSHESKIMNGKLLLARRLCYLQLKEYEVEGDGNCLFRACSFELFGIEDKFRYVREKAVRHMANNSDDYSPYCGTEEDFKKYLEDMARNFTWGDELTLRAICEVFGVHIHILTSNKDNCYLTYEPATSAVAGHNEAGVFKRPVAYEKSSAAIEATLSPGSKLASNRHVFMSYVDPIHYNAIIPHSAEGRLLVEVGKTKHINDIKATSQKEFRTPSPERFFSADEDSIISNSSMFSASDDSGMISG